MMEVMKVALTIGAGSLMLFVGMMVLAPIHHVMAQEI
jgi:hypothetical protein